MATGRPGKRTCLGCRKSYFSQYIKHVCNLRTYAGFRWFLHGPVALQKLHISCGRCLSTRACVGCARQCANCCPQVIHQRLGTSCPADGTAHANNATSHKEGVLQRLEQLPADISNLGGARYGALCCEVEVTGTRNAALSCLSTPCAGCVTT